MAFDQESEAAERLCLNPFFVFLGEFLSGDFLKASYFESTKDRVIRGLRTYFESRRADSHAMYYRDALLASKDNGIDESLALATEADLASVKEQFERVLANSEVTLDCLFSGNVSAEEAKKFFFNANSRIKEAQKLQNPAPFNPAKLFIPSKEQ
jgi:hypothetical protein